MLEQTLAIIRNTFFESIRQPIMLVLLVVATLLIIAANPLSAFTMEDDQRMLIDMGMATIFVVGALLAAFIATNVVGREIENKTALTVVSKPVGRPIFIIGKYIGVASALTMATVYMCLVFALVEQHTVLQTVREPAHIPTWVFGIAATVLGVGFGVWCNYFYNWVFTSTVIVITTPLVALAYVLAMRFDANFNLQPFSKAFKPQLWMGMGSLLVAILVMTSIALAASTRFKQVMTLVVTVAMFMLGMLSDWLFARPVRTIESSWLERAEQAGKTETIERIDTIVRTNGEVETITRQIESPTVALAGFSEGWETTKVSLLKVAHAIVPDFQVLWLSDALTQGHVIPWDYLLRVTVYGVLYIVAMLALAIVLFQRREVG